MPIRLESFLKATRDSKRDLSDFLPIYRQGIVDEDFRIWAFAVDSILIRAAIANEGEWADFVRRLETGDEYIQSVSWLGRVFGPMQGIGNAPNSVDHDKRRQTVLWLIEGYPETPIHQHIEATLNCLYDEPAYDIAKSLWFKKMLESPDSIEIASNAAHFCATREPAISRGFISICLRLEPDVQEWRRLQADLELQMTQAIKGGK